MLDRPVTGENVLLIHVNLTSTQAVTPDLDEFILLVNSTNVHIVDVIQTSRHTPDPKFFMGTGKMQTCADYVAQHQIDVVIFNHDLSPAQERNLEEALKARVLTRTGLILDIFAARARTFEGRLQVELAQLRHLSTRLIRGWTHLERQKGGIGLRGPGETQLETDRRLLQNRIRFIEKRLKKVSKQRQQVRRRRERQTRPLVAFVGYTNAGKSTLFNSMTQANVLAVDQLFATLDPTIRYIQYPDIGEVALADTVGFIQHLPHHLVKAFQATLEETQLADCLIHVIDASDPNMAQHVTAVNEVLEDLSAQHIPKILIYNKIDKIPEVKPHLDIDNHLSEPRVWMSANDAEQQNLVIQALGQVLNKDIHCGTLLLYLESDAEVWAKLKAWHAIIDTVTDEQGHLSLTVRLTQSQWAQLTTAYPSLLARWMPT